MSKGNSISAGGFFQELFHTGIYKRSQGRITRQVTFAAIFVTMTLAAWRLFASEWTVAWLNWSDYLTGSGQFVFPGLLLIAGVWIGYRIVNMAQFADFLISVEAEMNKVSWPSRSELFRSSLVVIFVIFSMAAILFTYDLVWKFFFQRILQIVRF